MSIKLKVILISIMLLFLIYVFRSIKRNILSTHSALLWVVTDIVVIFCIIFVEPLLIFTNFLGIKTVSNMMFFISTIFLLVLCFNLSNQLSLQNKKIINLTQELGILKNKFEKDLK